jgi:hypothetical protein
MASDREVVIAGGGPAGAVAARLLAGWGVGVELLTRPAPHRALIESLPPSAGKILEHAGLGPAVDAAGFIRATGNTAWWGAGPARTEPFGASGLGYQVLRSRFDRVLLDQAPWPAPGFGAEPWCAEFPIPGLAAIVSYSSNRPGSPAPSLPGGCSTPPGAPA